MNEPMKPGGIEMSEITVGDSPAEQAAALAKLKVGDWVHCQINGETDDQEVSGTLSVFDWDKKSLRLGCAIVRTETGNLGWNVRKILEHRSARDAWEDAEWVVRRVEGFEVAYRHHAPTGGLQAVIDGLVIPPEAVCRWAQGGTLHAAKVVVCDD